MELEVNKQCVNTLLDDNMHHTMKNVEKKSLIKRTSLPKVVLNIPNHIEKTNANPGTRDMIFSLLIQVTFGILWSLKLQEVTSVNPTPYLVHGVSRSISPLQRILISHLDHQI